MTDVIDPHSRILRLLSRAEVAFRAAFSGVVQLITDQHTLRELENLLEQGRFEEALAGVNQAARKLAATWAQTYGMSAQQTASFLSSKGIEIVFDQVNERAVSAIRRNQLRLIREFTEGQRSATREALLDGITRGANPREQARAFRGSIGLTQKQVQAVNNYRRALELGDRAALQRALRDKRFDRTVIRAIESGGRLTKNQIDTMVERYQQKMLKYRSEVIARTEALRSVHEGTEELYQQAIDNGDVQQDQLERTWNTAGDSRVRDTHVSMNGQTRPYGVPFTAGSGATLRFPGDPEAPASESIQCRCAVGTRIRSLVGAGVVGQGLVTVEQIR